MSRRVPVVAAVACPAASSAALAADPSLPHLEQKDGRHALIVDGEPATWKNGSNHYMPQWMKLQPEKYPNMTGPDGQPVDSPPPHAR